MCEKISVSLHIVCASLHALLVLPSQIYPHRRRHAWKSKAANNSGKRSEPRKIAFILMVASSEYHSHCWLFLMCPAHQIYGARFSHLDGRRRASFWKETNGYIFSRFQSTSEGETPARLS